MNRWYFERFRGWLRSRSFSLFRKSAPPGGDAARGDVVTWLPDADGQWEDASNWSSDPNLPGSSDDVTIDVGGATVRTVTLGSGNQSVQSLLCEENLEIAGANLTVGSGGGTVNGALTIAAERSLTVNAGSFSANGTASIDEASLYARQGGSIALPGASSYDPVATYQWRYMQAENEGSALDLSTLATVAGNGHLAANAYNGGKVDLSSITETPGVALHVNAWGTGSGGTGAVVDLNALTTLSPGSSLEVRDGGTVLAPNLTVLNEATLTIRDAGDN